MFKTRDNINKTIGMKVDVEIAVIAFFVGLLVMWVIAKIIFRNCK